MAKKDSRNLNVTINNKANDDDRDIVISISGVFRMLKKYFLPWLIISAMALVAIGGFSTFRAVTKKPALSALISFNYDGIEKGKDPSGRSGWEDFRRHYPGKPGKGALGWLRGAGHAVNDR